MIAMSNGQRRTLAGRRAVAAIDPGTGKCGVACIAADGSVLSRAIVSPEAVPDWIRSMAVHGELEVVLGNGTGHRSVARLLEEAGIAFGLVDERNTSAVARRRYLEANPPRGWRRLIPIGLRTPDQPYDDWVAIVLAERAASREDA